MIGQVAELFLRFFGFLKRCDENPTVLGAELFEHRFDRGFVMSWTSLILSRTSLIGHCWKVALSHSGACSSHI
jgi:hypothetical protein